MEASKAKLPRLIDPNRKSRSVRTLLTGSTGITEEVKESGNEFYENSYTGNQPINSAIRESTCRIEEEEGRVNCFEKESIRNTSPFLGFDSARNDESSRNMFGNMTTRD